MIQPKRFAILAYDGVEPIDIGVTYGVLSIARRVIPDIEMFLVAKQAGPVRLTNGLIIEAHHSYDDCPPSDVLIVTGGPGWHEQCGDPKTLQFIRGAAAQHKIVGSVCTGAMIVAAAGLLDGKRATTRRHGVSEQNTPLSLMKAQYKHVGAVEALVVDNGPVITGGGVTLGIDTMLYLLERMFGATSAAEVARQLEYSAAGAANARALPTFKPSHGVGEAASER